MEEDYYYDDIEEMEPEKSGRSKLSIALLLILSLIAGTLFLKSTLAANLRIGTAAFVEFGQGSTGLTACSGVNQLTITPKGSYSNGVGASGVYKLSSLTISNIPVGCFGDDLRISTYSDTGTVPNTYFDTTTVLNLFDNAGAFYMADTVNSNYTVTFANTTCTGGGWCNTVTVTLNNPNIPASQLAKFTIESTYNNVVLTCTTTTPCTIGGTGPGGGQVFFYSQAGFNCGPTFSSTGSPTGGLCHYLEAAPNNWYGGTDDPALAWALNNTQDVSGVSNDAVAVNSMSAIGLGYQNSIAIVNAGNDTTTASGAARAYRGNGLSDWYLPSLAELNVMCEWETRQAPDPTNICPVGVANTGLGLAPGSTGRFKTSDYWYWSSSEKSTQIAWDQIMDGGYQDASTINKTSMAHARPIRAF